MNGDRDRSSSVSVTGCLISFVSAVLAQFSLALVPHYLPDSPLLIRLLLSALLLLGVLGVGGRVRRFFGLRASAPAFVLFSIVYIWAVYVAFVRKAVSSVMDAVFNGEAVLLIVGFCRILWKDPGRIRPDESFSSESGNGFVSSPEPGDRTKPSILSSATIGRIRYCKSCRAYVQGFDHHCPAFGNCVGQNNHALFMVLLCGFMVTEASFVAASSKFASSFQPFYQTGLESAVGLDLVTGGMLFSLFQLLWQGVFFSWHLYCVCSNVKTEEWVNWKKYPEFQLVIDSEQGQGSSYPRFTNPYDKGVQENVKQFLSQGGLIMELLSGMYLRL